MTYVEFIADVLRNFRVVKGDKGIETIRVEIDAEDEDKLKVVSYNTSKSLIVLAEYKEELEQEIPRTHGYGQLDYLNQIINYAKGADDVEVKFKTNSNDVATQTTFKINKKMIIKVRNLAETLLPKIPRKLNTIQPEIEIELDEDTLKDIVKALSFNIADANVAFINNKGKLNIKISNEIDEIQYPLNVEVPEGVLEEDFYIDLQAFSAILKTIDNDDNAILYIAENKSLVKIDKSNDSYYYQYILSKKTYI